MIDTRTEAPEQTSTNGNGHGPEPFYIVASSPTADEQSLVLKQGDTFAVFDHFGDVTPAGWARKGSTMAARVSCLG